MVHYVVAFCDQRRVQDALRQAQGMGFVIVKTIVPAFSFVVDVPQDRVRDLYLLPGVCSVTCDGDCFPRVYPWALNAEPGTMSRIVSLGEAYHLMNLQAGSGSGVRVGIIGTGVNEDFVPGVEHYSVSGETEDTVGHETAIARVVRDLAPEARLMDVHALVGGVAKTSVILEAMALAVERGARVLNLSLGTNEPASPTEPVAHYADHLALERGIVSVIAGGNDNTGPGSVEAPAGSQFGIVVGSVNSKFQVSGFSGRGPDTTGRIRPDVAALGGDLDEGLAIPTGGSLGRLPGLRGTSFSAAFVTGYVAGHGDVLPEPWSMTTTTLIHESARGNAVGYKDNDVGYGALDGAGLQRALDVFRRLGPLGGRPPY